MNILGISLGHDSNISMVSDGKIIGIMEAERFFRQKRYKLGCPDLFFEKEKSGFQYMSSNDLNIILSHVAKEWGKNFDYVAVQNQGRVEEYNNLLSILKQNDINYKNSVSVNHHLSHASLAFYSSPFSESLVLSYDGTGNDGYTVFFKADGKSGMKYLSYPNFRFGQCYNNMGFIVGVKPDVSGTSSGKTMGLSAYGELREDWIPYVQ